VNRRVPTTAEVEMMAAAYTAGQTTVQIGATVGMSSGWVAERLKAAGLTLRTAGTQATPIDGAVVRKAYVDHNRPMTAIADELGVHLGAVRRALVDQGIAIRRHHHSIPCGELARLYVDQKMGTAAIADHFGLSRSQVFASLDRCGIEKRKPRSLDLTDQQLQTHLDDGLTDIEIADLYDVKAWNVRQRCRRSGLRRPPGGRFESQVPPKPDTLDLQLTYLHHQRSLSDIATQHHVTSRTVRRWLEAEGIEPREARRNTRPTGPSELPPTELRDFYTEQGWTTEEIAKHFGRSKKSVILALHHSGVPLRRPGAGGPRQHPIALVTALYDDADLCRTLKHHNIAIVPTFGTPSQRFPTRPDLSVALVKALYQHHGLSLTHIQLLTGHTGTSIRHIAQTAGIALRSGGRSPWVRENMAGP